MASTIKALMDEMTAARFGRVITGKHGPTGISFRRFDGNGMIQIHTGHPDAPVEILNLRNYNKGTIDNSRITLPFGPVSTSRAVARWMKERGF